MVSNHSTPTSLHGGRDPSCRIASKAQYVTFCFSVRCTWCWAALLNPVLDVLSPSHVLLFSSGWRAGELLGLSAAMGAQDRPQCFFDIEINREPVGRIIFQLFSDVCPKTCKNFLCLCTGEKGIGKTTEKKLCYKGSTFHRVVKNFMIQGGDFSEGNGKGGESIYGGYFKDENFILKHDRAFLLSMANRGKHTNGSQFFITTKPAPHLDGVHVVFGLVISGFEVIEQIENLKTDAASRPYADVRVIDCGVLVTKSAKDVLEKEKKRRVSTHSEASDTSTSSSSTSSETSSDSESENERSRKRKRKRRTKTKQSRKRRREERKKDESKNKRTSGQRSHSDRSEANEKLVDLNAKRDKPVVRPEEIPPVPENRFLLRRDAPVVNSEPEPKPPDVAPVLTDQKPSVSKSGRKIRGRGTIRYHTPPHSRSCSESDNDGSSETPPHWKEEMQRLRAYRPPSGEKWSKGDKLSDPGRWDERSLSQRSRSWSHNGYSDLSSAKYIGHHKKHRKEKKAKHKKKAKKQKHIKKHKQIKKKRLSSSTEMDSPHSSTRRTKSPSDHDGVSRSSSLSSRDDSSRRGWSKSERDKQSSVSLSSRDSRSYYRSRSRSYSRRSSRSRIAYKSSRSRSRSRSSSAPKHLKIASSSPKNVAAHLNDRKPVKVEPVRTALPQNDQVVVQPVVAENIPVIPLSDSPPPSRWKPGQKPWKPSYERIQEMKAKTTHLIPTQTTYSLVSVKDPGSSSSYHKRQKSSDSDQSDYSKNRSDRSSGSWRRSRSRTSRSRSYSKSYSRSRSPSSSRSRSRSRSTVRSRSANKFLSDQSCYSGSSSYFSLSEDDRQKSKTKSESRERNVPLSKKRQSSSESTLPYAKEATSQRRKESTSGSSLDFSTDSEQVAKAQPVDEKAQLLPEKANRRQKKSSAAGDGYEEKPRSEWSSDHFKKRTLKEQSGSPRSGRKARRKTHVASTCDSESDSEKGRGRNCKEESRLSSSKEEGEATSDTDTDLSLAKCKAKLDVVKTNKRSSPSESESLYSNTAAKAKSRKQKHSSKKNFKKAHSKKAKEKSKGKKEKKHKKQKETFHWQPPLEFGEEEEEDEDVTVKTGVSHEREKQITGVKNQGQDSESKVVKDKTRDGEKLQEVSVLSDEAVGRESPGRRLEKGPGEQAPSVPALNADENAGVSESAEPAKVNARNEVDVTQVDDMEICTPDHNSPVKVDVELSPVSLKVNFQDIKVSKNADVSGNSEGEAAKQGLSTRELTGMKEGSRERDRQRPKPSTAVAALESIVKTENAQSSIMDNKWKPLQGIGNVQVAAAAAASHSLEARNVATSSESKPQGLRIEIKSKNKIRPGSLFDEVRKTARLNRRPRNCESSSEEESPTRENSQSRSRSRSRSKSDPKSRHRTRSLSYSHSRSRSRSSTSYRSRSYTRSRSRGWYSRGRSRSRSSSYNSGRSHSRTYSRSRSRSSSYDHRSRSRSYTYDSYYSRSRSRSRSKRSDSYRRSRSYDRHSRSYSSDSESDRSYSNNRSPSESSRYS
ncbi:NK-tumor recognition protein isoform X2 [Varanus komodoensis]|uniref:NK-tumor recognition protein isoform X2 n=1 Tax=Varanus komodoensis TaxID=61221 RepID=UPI001CF7DC55|nr:NK-tumor recognition protein isoform X2 [Varanus komodoensis]